MYLTGQRCVGLLQWGARRRQMCWSSANYMPTSGRLWQIFPFVKRFVSFRASNALCKNDRHPFEVDINVAKNTTLYRHTNPTHIRLLGVFSIVMFVFFGQTSYFVATLPEKKDDEDPCKKDSYWRGVLDMRSKFKMRIFISMCISIGTAVVFFSVMYARRTVRQLVLLPGGQNIHIITYSFIGGSRAFTAPVDHISLMASRKGSATQIPFRIKGHRLKFLLDKKDGQFHHTDLFDYAVGLKREI